MAKASRFVLDLVRDGLLRPSGVPREGQLRSAASSCLALSHDGCGLRQRTPTHEHDCAQLAAPWPGSRAGYTHNLSSGAPVAGLTPAFAGSEPDERATAANVHVRDGGTLQGALTHAWPRAGPSRHPAALPPAQIASLVAAVHPALSCFNARRPLNIYSLLPPHAHSTHSAASAWALCTQTRGFHARGAAFEPLRSRKEPEPAPEETHVSPEDTDRIVAELRYRNITVPKTLDLSWQRRFESLGKSALGFARGTLKFLQSVPPALLSASRMSASEWRSTLSGWWVTIKHEGAHYWGGFKLFGFELRVASRLVWKQLQGSKLTRRERKQLTRTTADIFRMVPFSLFIIVPFAELLLPVALRLFPNMLPSTFQNQLKEEEELKKRLIVKMELARFLQETVGELAKDLKRSRTGQAADSAAQLYAFLKDVRQGEPVSNEDIVGFAKLFDDEITLDNMDRVHLVTLCEFCGLTQLGTNEFLRMRLKAHMNSLKADDVDIQREGIDEMTEDELRQACRARGMPAPFGEGSKSILKQQLEDWIDLSLNRNVPQSLLLLSRAFKLTTAAEPHKRDREATKEAAVQSLKHTLGMLPEDTISDVEMEAYTSSRDSPAKRLEFLRREEEDIKQEELAEAEHAAEVAAAQTQEAHQHALEASARATAHAAMHEAAAGVMQNVLHQGGAPTDDRDKVAYKAAEEKQERMKKVLDALSVLASASGVSKERALFMEVAKEEVGSMLDRFDAKGGSAMYFDMSGLKAVRPPLESVKNVEVTQQVSDYVSNILIRIEQDIDRVDSKIGEKLHLLDKDNDGMITKAELHDAIAFVKDELDPEDLEAIMQLLAQEDSSFSIKDLKIKLEEMSAAS